MLKEPVPRLAAFGEIGRRRKRKKLFHCESAISRALVAADKGGKLQQGGRHDCPSRAVPRFAGRPVVPVRNAVFGHVRVVDGKVCEFLRKSEIADVLRLAEHHRVAVYRPTLPARPRPGTPASRALSGHDLLDSPSVLVIVENMVDATIRLEMIRHRHIRMRACDLVKPFPVSRPPFSVLRRPFKEFQVHQVVWNHQEFIPVAVRPPAAEKPQTFVEALRQRFGGFHKYRVVFAGLQNALRIAERTIHHEPEVVRPRQRLVGFEKFRPDNRPVSEESVARRLVKIPQRPRIESRRPVENRNHPEASVLRKPARDLDFPFLRLHEPDGVRVERPVVSGCLCEYPGEPSGKLTLRSVRSRRSGDKRRDCDSGRNDSSHGRSYRCVTPQCTPRGRRRYL